MYVICLFYYVVYLLYMFIVLAIVHMVYVLTVHCVCFSTFTIIDLFVSVSCVELLVNVLLLFIDY